MPEGLRLSGTVKERPGMKGLKGKWEFEWNEQSSLSAAEAGRFCRLYAGGETPASQPVQFFRRMFRPLRDGLSQSERALTSLEKACSSYEAAPRPYSPSTRKRAGM